MTRVGFSGISLGLLLLGGLGCSAAESEPELAGRGDHPSDASQALDLRSDRPAAAAVGVLVDTAATPPEQHALRATRQLWLFACSRDHELQRAVRPSVLSKWSAWSVEATTPCAGTPSVSAWAVSPHDSVEVVYRSTDNRLIELAYDGDQAARELDLSATARFGNLASNCNPVITDMGHGARMSIAVRSPANQLFTLTAHASRWHVEPARGANGAQVFAESTLVGWYTNRRAFLSAVHDGVTQTFTRYTWKQGLRAFNGPVPAEASHGLITFTIYRGRILAVGRDASGALVSSPVDRGWSFTPVAWHSFVQSTVYLGASYAYDQAASPNTAAVGISLASAGNALFLTGFDFFNPTGVAARSEQRRVASANAVVANPGPELWADNFVADADDQLLWSGGPDRSFAPLGLAVSY